MIEGMISPLDDVLSTAAEADVQNRFLRAVPPGFLSSVPFA